MTYESASDYLRHINPLDLVLIHAALVVAMFAFYSAMVALREGKAKVKAKVKPKRETFETADGDVLHVVESDR